MAKKSTKKKSKPRVKNSGSPVITHPIPGDQRRALIGRILLIVIIALGGIYVYLWLNYSGLGGFIDEHKKFPGFNDPAIADGRKKVTDKLASANSIVGTNLGAKYVSPLQTRDICYKGEHQPPFAGATNDNYAYWCTIQTAQYYAYEEDVCTIATKLYQADISFQTTSDCTSMIPDLKKGLSTYYFSSHNEPAPKPPYINLSFTVEPAQTYQSTLGYSVSSQVVDSNIGCWNSRRLVYCKGINTRPEDQTAINTELTHRQSVVMIYVTQATTYQK